jgi:hypothetical protein
MYWLSGEATDGLPLLDGVEPFPPNNKAGPQHPVSLYCLYLQKITVQSDDRNYIAPTSSSTTSSIINKSYQNSWSENFKGNIQYTGKSRNLELGYVEYPGCVELSGWSHSIVISAARHEIHCFTLIILKQLFLMISDDYQNTGSIQAVSKISDFF